MRKSVEKVLGKLKSEGASFYTARKGFLGDPVDPSDRTFYTTRIFIGGRRDDETLDEGVEAHLAACMAAELAIKEKFGYLLTKANYKDVIAAYESEAKRLGEERPTVDERRTRDEDADLQEILTANREKEDAARVKREAIAAEVRELAPAGTQSVLIAQLKEDCSDPMSDYFANKTLRTVVIGFSHKTREDFKELHRAAAAFPETAHLADQESLNAWIEENYSDSYGAYLAENAGEHRDNYSMGHGNYLSDHSWDGSGSGWVVKRTSLSDSYPYFSEIADHLKVGVSA